MHKKKVLIDSAGLIYLLKLASASLRCFRLERRAISDIKVPVTSIVRDGIQVSTPTGRQQLISLKHEIEKSDIKFEDLNFDGVADIKVLRERGASQKFYDVYLYSKKYDVFQLSNVLSNIPCVEASARTKEVIGTCFHESACENWEEHYLVDTQGNTSLIERTGTYCDPTGGIYSYTDVFKGGKKLSSRVKQINAD